MKYKILIFLAVFLLILLGYFYFLLNHTLTFQRNFQALPSQIVQSFRSWEMNLSHSKMVSVKEKNFHQEISIDENNYHLQWQFDSHNETETQLTLTIQHHKKKPNFSLPIFKSQSQEKLEKLIQEFFDFAHLVLENTKIEMQGLDTLKSSFCVCKKLQSRQNHKAKMMMAVYQELIGILEHPQIESEGNPLVKIENWNKKTDSIAFNFCFPIKKKQDLPPLDQAFYLTIDTTQSLLANYYGNYITSDRAWYVLENYAKNNNFDIVGFPIEIFFNNPNIDRNEKNWKAAIYLPIR